MFSQAGKTTLLDVLASRVTMGVVSGDMLVDAAPRKLDLFMLIGISLIFPQAMNRSKERLGTSSSRTYTFRQPRCARPWRSLHY